MNKIYYFLNLSFRKIIGYTISFFGYSTWQGRTHFLEDLYVHPEYRKIGAGRALFINASQFARQNNCKRLDFHVLSWNPAKEFYKKMGATNLTESEDWEFYRMYDEAMDKLRK